MSRVPRYHVYALAMFLAAALVVSALHAQHGAPSGEWRSYAGDNGSTRYAPLDQITRDNVKDLQVAWSWKFDNFGGGTSETTPLMVNGVLYFTVGPRRNVVAVERRHGRDAVDVAARRRRAFREGAAQGRPRRRVLDRRHGRANHHRHAGLSALRARREDRTAGSRLRRTADRSTCSSSSI